MIHSTSSGPISVGFSVIFGLANPPTLHAGFAGTKREKALKDLEVPDGQSTGVKGGRKARGGSPEYFKETMQDVIVSS